MHLKQKSEFPLDSTVHKIDSMINSNQDCSCQHGNNYDRNLVFITDSTHSYKTAIDIKASCGESPCDMTLVDSSTVDADEDNCTIISDEDLDQIEETWVSNDRTSISRDMCVDSPVDEYEQQVNQSSMTKTNASFKNSLQNGTNIVAMDATEDAPKSLQEDEWMSPVGSSQKDFVTMDQDHAAASGGKEDLEVPLCVSGRAAVDSFRVAMIQSQYSKKNIQDWDKKMGLSRVHSHTMLQSEISRKKLYENVLPSLSELFRQ